MKKLQPYPESVPATSGIFGTRGRAPSVFPSLPPRFEELKAERVIYYHDILDTLPQMAFELDEGGRITFINGTALGVLGYSREETSGRAMSDLIEGGEVAFRDALAGINPGPIEHLMRKADGGRLPVRCTLTIIVNEGRVIGLRGIAMDMSEAAGMRKELERAERRRASYESAARCGHDLRNMLCALKGGVSFLQAFDYGNLSPRDLKDIGEILKDQMDAIDRGTALTGDMMQLATAERMDWGAVDLSGVLEGMVRGRRQQCAQGSIVAVCDIEPGITLAKADRHKLFRALDNIVANAVDSMPGGGLLEVIAGRGILDGKPAAHVCIRDSGCGIAPEMLETVFEPFVTTKGTSGTGLGLAIAAAVIDAHGGRISVRSEMGKGTEFEILIPS